MPLRAADGSREPFGHYAKRSRFRILCARMQPPNYKEAEQIYYCKYLNMYAARTGVATRRCVWQLSRVMIYAFCSYPATPPARCISGASPAAPFSNWTFMSKEY